MNNSYTCEACKETFEKGWTDEEAQAEAEELWSKEALKDKAIICDDCYNEFLKWYKPKLIPHD